MWDPGPASNLTHCQGSRQECDMHMLKKKGNKTFSVSHNNTSQHNTKLFTIPCSYKHNCMLSHPLFSSPPYTENNSTVQTHHIKLYLIILNSIKLLIQCIHPIGISLGYNYLNFVLLIGGKLHSSILVLPFQIFNTK